MCPEVRLVHVETIGGADTSTVPSKEGRQGPVKQTQKACLERYRVANAEILSIIHEEVPSVTVEKASIDEVYIDVTPLVDVEMEKRGENERDSGKLHQCSLGVV